MSCDEEPPSYSLLHLHQIPPSGGDTLFANMYAAYDALSDTMKGCLADLRAVNGSRHHFRDYFGYEGHDLREEAYPEATHPVVRTHPETGKTGLYIHGGFLRHDSLFDGRSGERLERAESEAIVRELLQQHGRPEYTCRFEWTPGSIAFWDNRAVQHYAASDYHPHKRILRRITVSGDEPFYNPAD